METVKVKLLRLHEFGTMVNLVVSLKYYGCKFYTNGALSKILFELIRLESKLYKHQL